MHKQVKTECIIWKQKNLLSNTKLTKYIIQLILIGDLAGDFAEIVETAANIQRYQISGEHVIQSILDIIQ